MTKPVEGSQLRARSHFGERDSGPMKVTHGIMGDIRAAGAAIDQLANNVRRVELRVSIRSWVLAGILNDVFS